MNRYTIYCTPEQTEKALELGAPIHSIRNAFTSKDIPHFKVGNKKDWVLYLIPTAEQMIGWLEEQEPIKEVAIYKYETRGELNWCCDIYKEDGDFAVNCIGKHISRKEATIAAIDAALEYLISNKK